MRRTVTRHERPRRTGIIERHCDVAVIGGSAAGLAAALQLGRQRRSVIVVDAGEPRNAPAAHMHGYLGHEGAPPADAGRDRARGGAQLRRRGPRPAGCVSVDRSDDDRFRVELAGGHAVVARRVRRRDRAGRRAARHRRASPSTGDGGVDPLPVLPRLRGARPARRPDRHPPDGPAPAALFRQLTDRLTVVLHGDGVDVDAAEVDALRAAGVPVGRRPVDRIVTGADGAASPASNWSTATTPRGRRRRRRPPVPSPASTVRRASGSGPSRTRSGLGDVRRGRRDRARRRCRACTPPATSPIRASRCSRPRPTAAGSAR